MGGQHQRISRNLTYTNSYVFLIIDYCLSLTSTPMIMLCNTMKVLGDNKSLDNKTNLSSELPPYQSDPKSEREPNQSKTLPPNFVFVMCV